MKTTLLTITAALFAIGINAQTKNVQSESTTTVRTVKDSDGERKLVKTTEQQQSQNLQFKDAESKELNKDLVASPTQVTTTTTVTAPDGTTRSVDVDRSAVYTLDGQQYKVVLDNVGYTVLNNNKKYGVLRNTGTNSYIMSSGGKTSYGSFDANGNLTITTYDDKTDKTTTATYTRN
ncbi:MAG: hypothetical protein EOO94_03755 [Pedobacter sp.]|nr:MAG: hypothetical protein EOO94_03755 [Pedobacter sp.]